MSDVIAIACDHGGYHLKEAIKSHFKGIDWIDFGTDSEESVDYPDFGQKLAKAITEGVASRGILICGSGIGISIAANRYPAVRAALCTNEEMAALARQHNDANVLALGARITPEETIFEIIEIFLHESFEGGRHERRVQKLSIDS